MFLEQILIFIFLKKPCGVFPPFENVGEKPRAGLEKPRRGFQKPRGVFNFDHFFHHDGIYFFSHNYICFAPLCLYLCNLVVLSLLLHKKDDVILPNSGVAKKNWWLFITCASNTRQRKTCLT